MFCKYCGSPIKDGAKFCNKCGKPVPQGNGYQNPDGNKPKKGFVWLIVSIAVVIIAAAIILLLLLLKNKDNAEIDHMIESETVQETVSQTVQTQLSDQDTELFETETIRTENMDAEESNEDMPVVEPKEPTDEQWENLQYDISAKIAESYQGESYDPSFGAKRYRVEISDGNVIADTEVIEYGGQCPFYYGLYRIILQPDDTHMSGYSVVSAREIENSISINSVNASSTLIEKNSIPAKYQPENILDHNMKTAWVEGADDEGMGEYIQINFDKEEKVHGLCIAAGYMKSLSTYTENARPIAVAFDFSDGTYISINLDDMDHFDFITNQYSSVLTKHEEDSLFGLETSEWDYAKKSMDIVSFGREIETSYVRITILDTVSGTKYSDTCISEISLY